jgi:hypothetical protein
LRGGRDPLIRADRDAFYLRVLNWMLRFVEAKRRGPVPFVDGIAARERAEICRQCPFQHGWEKDCSTCRDSSKAVQRQILEGREDFGRGLLGCLPLSENTAISVHLDEAQVADEKLPAHCWRKKK